MADLNPILRAALEVQSFCEGSGWRFCFIGGVAVQRWGEPRLTVDVDLTLISGFGREEHYADRMLGRFAPRRADARELALSARVLLLADAHGTPIDVALGAIPFEERSVDRATPFQFAPECRLITCSAEDLLVHKCFANRDRDWADVEGILLRCGERLDLALVRAELRPLAMLKEEPGILSRFEKVLRTLS